MAWLSKFRFLLPRLAALCLLLGASGAATAWWQADWPYRKQITIDGTATGAAVQGELANVPVLIRLHEGVFHFPDAKPDGSDLRFVTEDDKTELKFHIEKYDSVFNMAQIWVQVPALSAKEPVRLWMYYGNAKESIPATAPSAATYDANQILVYHFGERGTPAMDATGNALHATTPSMVVDSGLIGAAAKFDGATAIALPVSPLLSLLPTTEFTLSFWIKPVAADPAVIVYAQRDPAGAALVVGLNAGAPYVSVADEGGAALVSSPTMSIADGNWHRVSVVAGSAQMQIFVDGQLRSFLARGAPNLTSAATLGGDGGIGEGRSGTQDFRGEIDEFSIARVARTPAWLALEAGNQGAADKLVVFGVDEEQSSFSSGYVGIIMGSVTLDGWIVIGLLIVMMIISWVIMIRKSMQISRVGKANAAFLAAYRQAGNDFARLHHALLPGASRDLGLDDEAKAALSASPILHMFNEGIRELQQRIGKETKAGRNVVLSGQSIDAIRASLNAVFVRELQALNHLMVMLTIAISGGPFLGLLGTVVGVMITFAAVAIAGDVNVNAIAPGISAALAATVAGLAVAIPALFGYNYLLTRIKECSVEMQVFVDVFVARIAESYNDSKALHDMADD